MKATLIIFIILTMSMVSAVNINPSTGSGGTIQVINISSVTAGNAWIEVTGGSVISLNTTGECGIGDYLYGFNSDGTPKCRSDATGGSGMNYTNVALTNQSNSFTGNQSTDSWWNGLFNWTVTSLSNWVTSTFNGSSLTIDINKTAVVNEIGNFSSENGTIARKNIDNNFTTGQTINGNLNVTTEILNWTDYLSQSVNPPAPPANVTRIHSSTIQGFTRLEQDNEAPTNIVLGRDTVFIVKNTAGVTGLKAQAVYSTGSAGTTPTVGLALANSTTTLPSLGIFLDNVSNNAFGQVMQIGIIYNVDTSAYTAGDTLYVSPTQAGNLTNVRPSYPNLAQRIGTVLFSNVANGVIFVDTAPFIGGIESGTTSATYQSGANNTFTGTQNVTIGSTNFLVNSNGVTWTVGSNTCTMTTTAKTCTTGSTVTTQNSTGYFANAPSGASLSWT